MMRLTLSLALALVSLSSLASAQSQSDLTPPSFSIKNITSSGDACQPGKVSVNISEDKEAFTVSFADFVAEKGPDAVAAKRRSCRLAFDTDQDPAWEYGVMSITMRGFAQLDPGVRGRQEIRYGSARRSNDSVFELRGPYADNYIHADEVNVGAINWTGCQLNAAKRLRDFVVTATATVTGAGKNSAGLLTVDSADGQLEQVYELVWRRCGDTTPRFVSQCAMTGANGRTITAKAMGRTAAAADAKLAQKVTKVCSRVGAKFGACGKATAQCSTSSF